MIRKTLILIVAFILPFTASLKGQVTSLPYSTDFNGSPANSGWASYAISGTNAWEHGVPSGQALKRSFFPPNVWATNLDGNFPSNSIMALESPAFDFSDTSKTYRLSFAIQRQSNPTSGLNMEYSVNNGPWQILNASNSNKKDWYNINGCLGLNGEPAWFGNTGAGSFSIPFIRLSALKGFSNVRFRFKFGSASSNLREGVVIDDFRVVDDQFNLYLRGGDTVRVNSYCENTIHDQLHLGAIGYTGSTVMKVEYFLSTDTIFDSSDSLIHSYTGNFLGFPFSQQIDLSFLSAGNYNLFTYIDADSVFTESIENDNWAHHPIKIETRAILPLVEDFDDSTSTWTPSPDNQWKLRPLEDPVLGGAHSGSIPWTIFNSNQFQSYYLQSPSIDPSAHSNMVISYWYKAAVQVPTNVIDYDIDCLPRAFSRLNTGNTHLKPMTDKAWDFTTLTMPAYITSASEVTFRFNNDAGIDMALDDIYIGPSRPDLSVERNEELRYGDASFNSDTLKLNLCNSGLMAADTFKIRFYWSIDSILDSSDVLLGNQELAGLSPSTYQYLYYGFTRPSNVSGTYYIFYEIDFDQDITEMREYNNAGYFPYEVLSRLTIPYANDFEQQISGWTHSASFGNDNWDWASPKGIVLDTAFSGTKGFITADTGIVSANSRMHLYSPIFDLSTVANPVISFNMLLEYRGYSYYGYDGKINMSYSIDGGATWSVLDTTSKSYTRWYYPQAFNGNTGNDYTATPFDSELFFASTERVFVPNDYYNGRDARRNTHYVLDLGFLSGQENVRFRYNLATTENINNPSMNRVPSEGVLIDDFEISDASVDLLVDYQHSLSLGPNSVNVPFVFKVRNMGNYMSSPSITKFYLSVDTVLDSMDYYLGVDSIGNIRPDLMNYSNLSFPAATNLGNYQYLIYHLDASDSILESNEQNNIGAWSLGMDGISSFPYSNDFSKSEISGWYEASVKNGPANHRFRNQLTISETYLPMGYAPEQYFTDRINSISPNPPKFFLYPPVFDFSAVAEIDLSFDLHCTGKYTVQEQDGGNMQYSIDGGQTWSVLNRGANYQNWYDPTDSLNSLDNEPGWHGSGTGYNLAVLTHTANDVSFLAGEKEVQFRFKYRSYHYTFGGGTPHGMRIDNFLIDTKSLDLVVDTVQSVIHTDPSQSLVLKVHVDNYGPNNSQGFQTSFYLSQDSVFDSSDVLFQTISLPLLLSGDSLVDSVNFNHPLPLTQPEYYVFWLADATDLIVESDETNNLGSFKIVYPDLPNLELLSKRDTLYCLPSLSGINVPYELINSGSLLSKPAKLYFYWSLDTIWSSSDSLLGQVQIDTLAINGTAKGSEYVSFPWPNIQPVNYIFMQADALDSVMEFNEEDNTDYHFMIIDPNQSIDHKTLKNETELYFKGDGIAIECKSDFPTGSYQVQLTSASGQLICKSQIELMTGHHYLPINQKLSRGIYLVSLINSSFEMHKKLYR
tara:strand:- start:979 stop:5370 length:4392 start_codon:yes stop_codon:yes gene_type:complete